MHKQETISFSASLSPVFSCLSVFYILSLFYLYFISLASTIYFFLLQFSSAGLRTLSTLPYCCLFSFLIEIQFCSDSFAFLLFELIVFLIRPNFFLYFFLLLLLIFLARFFLLARLSLSLSFTNLHGKSSNNQTRNIHTLTHSYPLFECNKSFDFCYMGVTISHLLPVILRDKSFRASMTLAPVSLSHR